MRCLIGILTLFIFQASSAQHIPESIRSALGRHVYTQEFHDLLPQVDRLSNLMKDTLIQLELDEQTYLLDIIDYRFTNINFQELPFGLEMDQKRRKVRKRMKQLGWKKVGKSGFKQEDLRAYCVFKKKRLKHLELSVSMDKIIPLLVSEEYQLEGQRLKESEIEDYLIIHRLREEGAYVNTRFADCVEGDCYTGKGFAIWPNGDEFRGEFKHGLASEGNYFNFKDSTTLEGTFKSGLASGRMHVRRLSVPRYNGTIEFFKGIADKGELFLHGETNVLYSGAVDEAFLPFFSAARCSYTYYDGMTIELEPSKWLKDGISVKLRGHDTYDGIFERNDEGVWEGNLENSELLHRVHFSDPRALIASNFENHFCRSVDLKYYFKGNFDFRRGFNGEVEQRHIEHDVVLKGNYVNHKAEGVHRADLFAGYMMVEGLYENDSFKSRKGWPEQLNMDVRAELDPIIKELEVKFEEDLSNYLENFSGADVIVDQDLFSVDQMRTYRANTGADTKLACLIYDPYGVIVTAFFSYELEKTDRFNGSPENRVQLTRKSDHPEFFSWFQHDHSLSSLKELQWQIEHNEGGNTGMLPRLVILDLGEY